MSTRQLPKPIGTGDKTMAKDNPGTVYVIHELDFLIGVKTNLAKIGIVKDPRTPEDRLKEHQTGNSKKLSIEATFRAEDVSAAEALCHRRLATKRVNGEWFEPASGLEADTYGDEIELAIKDSSNLLRLSRQVKDLSTSESNGKTRGATDSELELSAELADYENSIRCYESQQALIRVSFAQEIQSAFGVEGVCEWTFSQGKSDFSMAALKLVDPKLFASLMEKKVGGTFATKTPRGKAPAKTPFPADLPKLIKAGHLLDRSELVEEKHLRYLELEEQKAQLSTIKEEIRLTLMISVANCDEVKDVATWKRLPVDRAVAGAKDFVRTTAPEKFLRAHKTSSDSRGLNIVPYRAYPR